METKSNYRLPLLTPRLRLKRESLDDFERFFAMSKDSQVMKYIGDGSIFHWTKKVAREKFKSRLDQAAKHAPGNLAVYEKAASRYLGLCEIRYSKFLNHIEFGYRFCSDAWNCGFATEAGTAFLGAVFRMSGIETIQACTHPENIASIRVLEKLGFDYLFSRKSRSSGRKLPVFGIERYLYVTDFLQL